MLRARGGSMREPWEWKETDIQRLIRTGEKESLILDYKACDALGTSGSLDMGVQSVSEWVDAARAASREWGRRRQPDGARPPDPASGIDGSRTLRAGTTHARGQRAGRSGRAGQGPARGRRRGQLDRRRAGGRPAVG